MKRDGEREKLRGIFIFESALLKRVLLVHRLKVNREESGKKWF